MNIGKRLCALIAGATAVLLTGFGLLASTAAAAQSTGGKGQNGTGLSATVTASGSQVLSYGWHVTKSVSPGTLNLWQGFQPGTGWPAGQQYWQAVQVTDTGTAHYTVTATKDGGTLGTASASGNITVTNSGGAATNGLVITADLQQQPKTPVVTGASVDVSAHPVLQPGETESYPYTITLPGAPVAGATYKVTAQVTILNHSGSLGMPFGPSPSATFTSFAQTTANNQVNVTDSMAGSLGTISGTTAFPGYTETFSAPGQYPNTVQVTGDNGKVLDQATAPLDVNGYTPPIQMTTDGTSYVLHPDGSTTDFKVWGTITVTNPNGSGMPLVITNVVDSMSGSYNMTLTDTQGNAVAYPYTLQPGASLIIKYHCDHSGADRPFGNPGWVYYELPGSGGLAYHYTQSNVNFDQGTVIIGS